MPVFKFKLENNSGRDNSTYNQSSKIYLEGSKIHLCALTGAQRSRKYDRCLFLGKCFFIKTKSLVIKENFFLLFNILFTGLLFLEQSKSF